MTALDMTQPEIVVRNESLYICETPIIDSSGHIFTKAPFLRNCKFDREILLV